jgi:outer membrane lipoprotein SlyB
MKNFKSLTLLCALPFLGLAGSGLTGCAPDISPYSYNVQNTGAVSRVVYGKIMSVQPVHVAANNTGVGAIAGGVAGAAGGSAIGGGTRANIIGGVGGALVGGLLGNYAESKLRGQTGLQYVIRTDGGHTIAITQGAQNPLSVGQRVMVLLGPQARVQPVY